MKARNFSIYTSVISIIAFITQLTDLNDIAKKVLLFASVLSLFALLLVSILKKDIVSRNKIIKTGNSIILNTKDKLVLFGGDLSWANDYINSIKILKRENKIIEIYFPQSKYENCTDNEDFFNRIIDLKEAGARVYSLKNDYGLRCIISDPDSYNSNDNMEIMITDRIYRNKSNTMKNKYSLKHLKYSNKYQRNICKSYITNYNYIKNNIFSEY